MAPLLALVEWVLTRLPDGRPPSLPPIGPLWDAIAGLDSLVPIIGPLTFMLGLLSVGAVFVVLRLVLTVFNLIWP